MRSTVFSKRMLFCVGVSFISFVTAQSANADECLIDTNDDDMATALDTSAGADGSGRNALACGTAAIANNTSATAFGANSQATSIDTTAIGQNAIASAGSATAIGTSSVASQIGATALGLNSQATNINTTALGSRSIASDQGSTAVGQASQATGINATAVGQASRAFGGGTVAIGLASLAEAESAIAIGQFSRATGEGSTALGRFSEASATDASAIGFASWATATNSVAIGAHSIASRQNTLSVGSSGNERQVVHVAAGTQDTDAVNVAQLNLLRNSVLLNTQSTAQNALLIAANRESLNLAMGAINGNRAAISQVREGVAAIAAIPDLYLQRNETWTIAGGLSLYDDEFGGSETGVSAGAQFRTSTQDKWSIGIAAGVTPNTYSFRIQGRIGG